MKFFRSFLISAVLCPVILMTSCTFAGNGKDGETEYSGTRSDTPSQTEGEKEPERFFVSKDGVCDYKIIRSTNVTSSVKRLCAEFRTELERRAGGNISIGDDFISYNESVDPEAKELIIGETEREESIKLKSELDALGGNRYGIYAAGPKVAVLGTDTYSTYLGLLRLFEFMTGEDGKGELSFEKGYTYISDEKDNYFPDIAEARKNGLSLCFNVGEKVIKQVPTNGSYGALQGGGTDGTYAYYAMINKSNNEAYIYKYEIATWTLVKRSESLKLFHANDITYDAKNKRLVISACTANDGYLGVLTVDPETLELIDYFKIGTAFRALDYLPWNNTYIIGTDYFFTVMDENFNKIGFIDCKSKNYTTQGLCCDEKYIYDVRYVKGSSTHYIVVQDYDGNYYGEIPLIGAPSEPENMFRLGNEFFLGCNGSDSVLRVELLPEKFW